MSREKRGGRPEALGAILERLLAHTGLAARRQERRLLEAWTEVVGERLARHAQPVDIADGILTLRSNSAVWRQELTMLMPLIRQRLNERFGEGAVREIRWHRQAPRRRADESAG